MTYLADHQSLLQRLQQEMSGRAPDGAPLAILMMNLECLSRVDGIWGFAAGDALVRQIGQRLVEALREVDVVGQIGRSGFACILPAISSQGHAVLAVHKILRVLELPVELAPEQQVVILPRMGLALYPEHGEDAESLMQRANVAMHEAERKKAGFEVYQPEFDLVNRLQFELHADLRSAIKENELMLYYQPQLNLLTGKIDSAEALLRWNSRKRGFLPPGQVVAIAENTGLMPELTRWVINTALRQRTQFKRDDCVLKLGINLSATNLQETDLVELFRQGLNSWQVPADQIVVELTESAVMDEQPGSLEVLKELKALGMELSMDDFGTGYSSMLRLRKLPLDELKIDLQFVRNMMVSTQDEKIVLSMINLAHNLDLHVVAEGVEDEPTLECLRAMGCDKIQGFYLSQALPAKDFLKLVKRRNKKTK